jgi:hypothetical protein
MDIIPIKSEGITKVNASKEGSFTFTEQDELERIALVENSLDPIYSYVSLIKNIPVLLEVSKTINPDEPIISLDTNDNICFPKIILTKWAETLHQNGNAITSKRNREWSAANWIRDLNSIMPNNFASKPGDLLLDKGNRLTCDANKMLLIFAQYPERDLHLGHALHVLNILENHKLSSKERQFLGKHALYFCTAIARAYEIPELIAALEFQGLKAADENVFKLSMKSISSIIGIEFPSTIFEIQKNYLKSFLSSNNIDATINSRIKSPWAFLKKAIAGRSPHDYFGHTIFINDKVLNSESSHLISLWIEKNIVDQLNYQGFQLKLEHHDNTFLYPREGADNFKVIKLVGFDPDHIPCEIQITTQKNGVQNKESHIAYKFYDQDDLRHGKDLERVKDLVVTSQNYIKNNYILTENAYVQKALIRFSPQRSFFLTTKKGNHSFILEQDRDIKNIFLQMMDDIHPDLKTIVQAINISHPSVGDQTFRFDSNDNKPSLSESGIYALSFLDQNGDEINSLGEIMDFLSRPDVDSQQSEEIMKQYPLIELSDLKIWGGQLSKLKTEINNARLVYSNLPYSLYHLKKDYLDQYIESRMKEMSIIQEKVALKTVHFTILEALKAGDYDMLTSVNQNKILKSLPLICLGSNGLAVSNILPHLSILNKTIFRSEFFQTDYNRLDLIVNLMSTVNRIQSEEAVKFNRYLAQIIDQELHAIKAVRVRKKWQTKVHSHIPENLKKFFKSIEEN